MDQENLRLFEALFPCKNKSPQSGASFEIPKHEDSISEFQTLFNMRNMELKISQHIRRTCLWVLTLNVEDTALIWTFTPANNKKPMDMQNFTLRR